MSTSSHCGTSQGYSRNDIWLYPFETYVKEITYK